MPVPDSMILGSLTHGFVAGAPGDPWFHVRANTYVTSGGVARPLPGGGLHVASRGVNPRTGLPAFDITLAPESRNGGIPGANDHAKWLAYMTGQSTTGFPGFDARRGAALSGTARLTGRTFGTELHPFGTAVDDPDLDLRLAAFGMTTIDVESWMVFDFLLTKRRIYVIYERLPFGRTRENEYAAFTYAVPVGTRHEHDVHQATVSYDRAAGTVTWLLDGVEVCRVTRIGRRLDTREHLLIDLGGVEQSVEPRQLAFGMGLFTLLDGALGTGPGLVRLSDTVSYYSPATAACPLQFVDEHSLPQSRLFGQGAEISIVSYEVYQQSVESGSPLTAGARS